MPTQKCKLVSYKRTLDLIAKRVVDEMRDDDPAYINTRKGQASVYYRLLKKGRSIWISPGKELRYRKRDRAHLVCSSKW